MAPLLQKFLPRIVRNEEGSVAIIVGMLLFLLIMAVGVAVDMARAQILQQRMSASLDAAGLAAAEKIGSAPAATCPPPETVACAQTWAQTVAQRYFTINFPSGYLGSTLGAPTVALPDGDMNRLQLSVTGTQAPVFMQTFGIGSLSIAASSEITRSPNGTGMELVLALDDTSSMACSVTAPIGSCNDGTTPKIQALKDSITGGGGLLDILFGSNSTVPNLYIGIVPFSQAVNVGGAITSSADYDTSYNNALSWGNETPTPDPHGQWGGCVEARNSPYTVTDDAPSGGTSATLLRDYFYRMGNENVGGDDYHFPVFYNTWPEPGQPHTTPNAFGDTVVYDYSDDPYGALGTGVGRGPSVYCPQAVTQMDTQRSVISLAINSLVPNGDTVIPEGMVWAWRMLSPNWRGHWTGPVMTANNLPLNYNTTNMKKVVILMTDGSNHVVPGSYTAYGLGGNSDPMYPVFSGDARLGVDENAAEATLDSNLQQICTSLKNNGVIVFTIAFGQAAAGNPSSVDRGNGLVYVSLLSGCAGNGGAFYLAPTNSALQTAFQQIGNTLTNIRISH